MDIQSAYDRVWHSALVVKLAQAHVPLALLGWINAFISRHIMTLSVGSTSLSCPLSPGVPQGSPLFPLLFLVYINDLLDALKVHAHVQAYADDIIVWWNTTKGESGEAQGRYVLSALEEWALRWRVTFNPTKCQFMIIGHYPQDPSPTLLLHGTPLVQTACMKYLGVWIDSSLSWKEHVQRVAQKALDHLWAIHHRVGTLWSFHLHILQRLIWATVFPILFYATPMWCGAVHYTTRLLPWIGSCSFVPYAPWGY